LRTGVLTPGNDPIAKALVDRFGMTPLPVEATFFAQTYRSAARTGDVPAGTAGVGLYSVEPRGRSLFHRLACSIWWRVTFGKAPPSHGGAL